MAQENNSPIIMDARKFVRQVNGGAAATLQFFSESIVRMGREADRNLKLVSLNTKNLIYEDVDTNTYYTADIEKNGRGRIDLRNVKPVQIVEDEKPAQFKKNLRDLVEAVCDGDYKSADKSFNKIEGQRYRKSVIPNSGWLTLKDGIARKITVSSRLIEEDVIGDIARLFCEAVSENVVVENGHVVSGTLIDNDPDFNLPVNEYTKRMLVARKMRDVASKAYVSESFQGLVMEVASLVCEGRVADACKLTSKFLSEEQEFTMLGKKGMRRLVENALATQAQFNSMLAQDVATLFYKTNVKFNKNTILEAWHKMAQKAENADLLTNVSILAESNDFEKDFDKFIDIVFAEDRNATVASMYKLALEYVQDKIPDQEGSDESANAKGKLGEIIDKLSRTEPDTYALIQAEEIFHTINDTITNSIDNLSNFQVEPGMEQYDDMSGDDQDAEMVPIPEVGQGDELSFGGPPAPGGSQLGAVPAPGAPMESIIKVSDMNPIQLLEELEAWRLNGDTYLLEDGYSDCYSQMESYIRRCIDLGSSTNVIRESFEDMRNRMVQTGDTVLADPEVSNDRYNDSVSSVLESPTSRIRANYRHTYLESEQPYSSAHVPSGLSSASNALRMDELQGGGGVEGNGLKTSDGRSSSGGSAAGYNAKQRGSGVAKKGVKPVDGRKGENSNSGAEGGSSRMDDKRGSGGVQSHSVKSSDGRKGSSSSSMSSESSVKPKTSGDPALAKSGFGSVGLSMGGDFQGKGGAEKKYAPHKSDGGDSTGASAAKKYTASGGLVDGGLDMSKDFQGKGGVESDSCDSDSQKGQGKVKSDGGLKASSKGGDMSGLQGGGGVAESITPENIAAMIEEMESLSEELPPEFLANIKGKGKDKDKDDSDSDNGNPFGKSKKDKKGKKSDDDCCSECDCDPCECNDNGDDDSDKGNPFGEDQYKSASMKKMGYKKSSINPSESIHRIANSMSEDVTAVVFKGDSEDVAAAVDRVLGGGGGDLDLEDPDVAMPELEDAGLPGEGMGDELEMGDEGPMDDEDGLENALDSAFEGEGEEGDEEGPPVEDELLSAGAEDGECPCAPDCNGGKGCGCGPDCQNCNGNEG